ncbi:MAG: DUF3500 domain-containing protein, partial [Rhodothermales bacterium]
MRSGGGYEAFYAWTQPVFTDERAGEEPTSETESQSQKLGAAGTRMVEAATAFLVSLGPEQRAKATYPFESDERYNWHFIPRSRFGLPLKEMTPEQRHRAHALMHTALSSRGYLKATSIMSLEEVLRQIETSGPVRDQEMYFFTVFGEPSPSDPWGWRLEGHHLSLNYSALEDDLSVTPFFLGANPAHVRTGPRAGLRVLANEEDLGRRLVESLSPAQRLKAIIAEDAPDDILSGTDRLPEVGAYQGLPASEMTQEQRSLLRAIIEEYTGNSSAREQMEKIESAGLDRLYFAWAGGIEPGARHYYRIHGPTAVFEYDNTQNDANHVHAVWRDLTDDFGADLLKRHYEESEHHDH